MLYELFILGIAGLFAAGLTPLLLFRTKSAARIISLLLTLASTLSLIIGSWIVLSTRQTFSMVLSRSYLFEYAIYIDRLSAFFIIIIAAVSFCVGIYTLHYSSHYKKDSKRNFLVALMNIFILSMILTVASKNMIAFLVAWELMSLSSFIFVMFEYESKDSMKPGLFYFVMTQLSTVFLIIAFVMISKFNPSWNIPSIAIGNNASAIILLLFLGFGIKAGIIPFHKWLPYAHPASPSNVSALMSGVMIKVAIYGLIRFILLLQPQLWFGILLLIAGTVSAILGVIYALKEHDIKRLLAYHSIENIGIIVIGTGLYVIFNFYHLNELALLSLLAALFHTLNHAIFKSLLFLTAGSVVNATKTKNIEEMGGLIKSMPYTSFLFLIGAVSISALPPFNGFMSELMIFQSFFLSSAVPDPMVKILLIVCLAVFAFTSALAAACFVKAFGIIFLAVPRSRHALEAKESKWSMTIASSLLALLCLVLGLGSYQIFKYLGYNLPIPNLMWIGLLMVATYIACFIAILAFASRKSRISETWGCGIISQNSKMEYTASGFSEPIITIFKPIYRPKREIKKEYFDSHNIILRTGYAEIHLLKFFEEYLYVPVIKAVSKIGSVVDRLHNGNLDTYILYVFLAALLLLVYVGWFF